MKKILLVAMLGIFCYGGWLFGRPYLTNHFLKGQMQGLADKAYIKTDLEIITELVAFSQDRDLPLEYRDFKVTRHDGRTSISVSYKQVVEVPFYSREYKFAVSVIS